MELPQRNRDLLESSTADYQILGDLHTMLPHAVYEVRIDGQRAVCKVDRGPRASAALEGRVLRYVDRETSVPVPTMVDVGSNGFVAAYRADAPEDPPSTRRLERQWLRVAGRTLATLHKEATFDRPGLPTVDGDPSDSNAGFAVGSPVDATWTDALDGLLAMYGQRRLEHGVRRRHRRRSSVPRASRLAVRHR